MPSPIKVPDLSKTDRDRLAQTGIDLAMTNRCGSYLQMDQDIVHAECGESGIEVLSYKRAMEKYDWLNKVQAVGKMVEIKRGGEDSYVKYDVFIVR